MVTNEKKRSEIERVFSSLEPIATIGSPSSTTNISLEIMGTAVQRKLVGEMIAFKFIQDGDDHYSLGQITEVQLRNIWLEDPTMKSLARQRGTVNPVSGQQDTHQGKMMPSAVFRDRKDSFEPTILGTVPATGTTISIVNDTILNTLLSEQQQEIFYFGNFYGAKTLLPLRFKHFGAPPNGEGQAYHIGIFGSTGSGKSTLAKMIMLGYARHPEMAIFVIDPVGQFARSARGEYGTDTFRLPMDVLLRGMNRRIEIRGIRNLLLDRWELFSELLFESRLWNILTISQRNDNRKEACETIKDASQQAHTALRNLTDRRSFDNAWQALSDPTNQARIYPSTSSRARFQNAIAVADVEQVFQRHWLPLCRLFGEREGAISIDRLIHQTFEQNAEGGRPVVIVDLSQQSIFIEEPEVQEEEVVEEDAGDFLWNENIQAMVIKRLLDALVYIGKEYYDNDIFLNTLVIMDEAQKLARREKYDETDKRERVRSQLVSVVETTRKFGLGWMFISLSLSSLHPDIYGQLGIAFYGYGLSSGRELDTLRDLISDPNALKLYQSFPHPSSAISVAARQYSFMTKGPVSPLSFAGTPLFLTAFNKTEDFISVNGLSSQESTKEDPQSR